MLCRLITASLSVWSRCARQSDGRQGTAASLSPGWGLGIARSCCYPCRDPRQLRHASAHCASDVSQSSGQAAAARAAPQRRVQRSKPALKEVAHGRHAACVAPLRSLLNCRERGERPASCGASPCAPILRYTLVASLIASFSLFCCRASRRRSASASSFVPEAAGAEAAA
jgi:hypothetical protein